MKSRRRIRWKKSRSGLVLPEGYEEDCGNRLDEIVLRLPCYEPSGLTFETSARNLLQHILVLGMTGSGKTTLLNRAWADLISFRSAHTDQRIGLLILDGQGDHTVEHLRQLAVEAGRADDLRVLSPGEGYLNPLEELSSFATVESVASKMIAATSFTSEAQHNNNDAFWTEGTRNWIESGLTYLLVHKRHASVVEALEFLSGMFLQPEWSSDTKAIIDHCDNVIAAAPNLSAGIRARLALAKNTLGGWKKLDSKTRSILQACLSITLCPFLSPSALRYWNESKGEAVRPADALDGKIVVVSVRAATEVETSRLICRLVKMEFYAAAQRRRSLGQNHLAGLIMDEFHYSVTSGSKRWSDISNLATLRGRGVFVVAATQGLVQLDLALGYAATEAVLIHFGNVIFLRSQETGHLYQFAEKIFGRKPSRIVPWHHFEDVGNLKLIGVAPHWAIPPEAVCPPGALAGLDTHQAYVMLANGYRTEQPVWLAPLFLPEPHTKAENEIDADLALLRRTDVELRVKGTVQSTDTTYYSVRLWTFLIDAAPSQVKALHTLTPAEFRHAMESKGHKPIGMETLPASWRLALLRLALRLPNLLKIARLAAVEGRLDVAFHGWSGGGKWGSYALEARWRHSVYPTTIRRIHARDLRWLKEHFPHLCLEIETKNTNNP